MSENPEFGSAYAAEQIRRSRHPLRSVIKRFYLDNVLRDAVGPTIDFGCGAGQLLARLPPGSVGLEINPFLVAELQKQGLDAMLYDAEDDGFTFSVLAGRRFDTLVLSHVLEHFAQPDEILKRIFASTRSLGVRRVVAVVPGAKGYRSDATHKTYIDRRYLERQGLMASDGFKVARMSRFPLDSDMLNERFTFHEFKIVFEREAGSASP
jgi:SAM-dependent methyltransferase